MSPQDPEYLLVAVRVPRTQSNHSFLNSKEWVDTAIQIAESKRGGTFESAKRITNHIHLIAQAGCCVASCHAAVSSSRRLLTAPPSRSLIAQAGCCVASLAPPSRPLVAPHYRPLTVPPSRCLIASSACCVFMELRT